jgi:hypothetical protein
MLAIPRRTLRHGLLLQSCPALLYLHQHWVLCLESNQRLCFHTLDGHKTKLPLLSQGGQYQGAFRPRKESADTLSGR